jgi:hypothetical protein
MRAEEFDVDIANMGAGRKVFGDVAGRKGIDMFWGLFPGVEVKIEMEFRNPGLHFWGRYTEGFVLRGGELEDVFTEESS